MKSHNITSTGERLRSSVPLKGGLIIKKKPLQHDQDHHHQDQDQDQGRSRLGLDVLAAQKRNQRLDVAAAHDHIDRDSETQLNKKRIKLDSTSAWDAYTTDAEDTTTTRRSLALLSDDGFSIKKGGLQRYPRQNTGLDVHPNVHNTTALATTITTDAIDTSLSSSSQVPENHQRMTFIKPTLPASALRSRGNLLSASSLQTVVNDTSTVSDSVSASAPAVTSETESYNRPDAESTAQTWADEEQQLRLDREWYNQEETGMQEDSAAMHMFEEYDDYYREKELSEQHMSASAAATGANAVPGALQKKMTARQQQFNKDNDLWETNRMLTSGVVQRSEAGADAEDDHEVRRSSIPCLLLLLLLILLL
jgi:hypothetical protein